jgi:hypothetical protein
VKRMRSYTSIFNPKATMNNDEAPIHHKVAVVVGLSVLGWVVVYLLVKVLFTSLGIGQ